MISSCDISTGIPTRTASAPPLDPTGLRPVSDSARHGRASSGPIRDLFRRAFEGADLPYYNPHSFRDMLVRHAMTLDLTIEEMKAWSQNLGHSDLLTTFTSYGTVPLHRQAELIRATGDGKSALGKPGPAVDPALVAKVLAAMQSLPGDGLA